MYSGYSGKHSKGRRFESHRGQAYFSRYTLRVATHTSKKYILQFATRRISQHRNQFNSIFVALQVAN